MSNQTILITGATSGIGRHAALWLAKRGHRVIATGRRQGALDELVAEAKDLAINAVRLDVTDSASIAAALEAVNGLTEGRGVDVLINNAGYGQGGAVLEVSAEATRAQFDTNVFGLMDVTKAFSAAMIARGSGRIINVSSIGGRLTLPFVGVYNATKYAVESLSDALRMELAPLGIQVVVVEPGGINTNFNETVTSGLSEAGLHGPWAEVQRDSKAVIARFERFAPDPTPISKAFTRAIESRWPRARYTAPFADAMMVHLVTLVLPTWFVDAALSHLMGMNKVRRPTPRLSVEEPVDSLAMQANPR